MSQLCKTYSIHFQYNFRVFLTLFESHRSSYVIFLCKEQFYHTDRAKIMIYLLWFILMSKFPLTVSAEILLSFKAHKRNCWIGNSRSFSPCLQQHLRVISSDGWYLYQSNAIPLPIKMKKTSWDCVLFSSLRAHSHWAKAKAKRKYSLMFEFFFDLFRIFFYFFFAFSFVFAMWTGSKLAVLLQYLICMFCQILNIKIWIADSKPG